MYSIKIEGSHNNFLYTSFPGPVPVVEMQAGSSFDQLEQNETAGSRRRRLRLYPRLAKGEAGKGGPSIGVALPTVEELLSGSLGKDDGPVETANDLPGAGIKKVIEVEDLSQKDSQIKERAE